MKSSILIMASVLMSGRVIPAQNTKQQSAPRPMPDQSVISVDVTRVNLLFTVSDKKGRAISNLGKTDFQIIENKKQQSILEFTANKRSKVCRSDNGRQCSISHDARRV